jgi:transposase InsO family protein
MRWRLYIEEYSPTFHYIKGEDNNIADALSRIPRGDESIEGQQQERSPDERHEKMAVSGKHEKATATEENSRKRTREDKRKARRQGKKYCTRPRHDFSVVTDDVQMANCFMNYPTNFPPVTSERPFPLEMKYLATIQLQDAELQRLATTDPKYHHWRLDENDGTSLIVYTHEPGAPWKICIPEAALDEVIKWYHHVLLHPGRERTQQTIELHFYNRQMRTRIERQLKDCDICQQQKNNAREYGELPPREAEVAPWETVAVDLIGPWATKIPGREIRFSAMTIIDTVTNYVEIARVDSKQPDHMAQTFCNAWLSRYPKPRVCISDGGGEFKREFEEMLQRYGIKKQKTTARNPQGNSIIERLHQTMGNSIRALLAIEPPNNETEANRLIETVLQTTAYAARATIHTTMQCTPGSLVFQRDMILNIPLIADFRLLQERRQAMIDSKLMRANRRRVTHDYQPGDKVLVLTYKPDKLAPRASGPFTIRKVHTNGTVTINRGTNLIERINIRRIKPYTSRRQNG